MAIEAESPPDERASDDASDTASDSAVEELLCARRRRRESSNDVVVVVKRLIAKYGSRDRAIEELFLENYKLRTKLREIIETKQKSDAHATGDEGDDT